MVVAPPDGRAVRVSAAEKARYQEDVRRLRKTISPKIRPHARCVIRPHHKTIYDRHGQPHRLPVFHVYASSPVGHPGDPDYSPEEWLGEFPFQEEAEHFAKGYMAGRTQVSMGGRLGSTGYRFGVRTFDTTEAPSVIITDRGPETK